MFIFSLFIFYMLQPYTLMLNDISGFRTECSSKLEDVIQHCLSSGIPALDDMSKHFRALLSLINSTEHLLPPSLFFPLFLDPSLISLPFSSFISHSWLLWMSICIWYYPHSCFYSSRELYGQYFHIYCTIYWMLVLIMCSVTCMTLLLPRACPINWKQSTRLGGF